MHPKWFLSLPRAIIGLAKQVGVFKVASKFLFSNINVLQIMESFGQNFSDGIELVLMKIKLFNFVKIPYQYKCDILSF